MICQLQSFLLYVVIDMLLQHLCLYEVLFGFRTMIDWADDMGRSMRENEK